MILKLYEDVSSSIRKFSKAKPYGLGHIKIESMNQDKRNGMVTNYFVNSVIDNSNWDKLSEAIIKKTYLEQSETLFER